MSINNFMIYNVNNKPKQAKLRGNSALLRLYSYFRGCFLFNSEKQHYSTCIFNFQLRRITTKIFQITNRKF